MYRGGGSIRLGNIPKKTHFFYLFPEYELLIWIKKEDFGVTVKLHFHTIHHFCPFSLSSEKDPHEYELIIWLKQRLDFLLLLSGAEVYLFTVQVFIIFREAC